jgi:hypothetical protein
MVRSATLLALGMTLLFGADAPLAGTWKLNLEKSEVSSGQVAGRATKIESEGNDLIVTLTGGGLNEDLKQKIVFDDREHPATPSPILRRTGATTFTASRIPQGFVMVYKKDGKIVATQRRTVSGDGRLLTAIVEGVAEDGTKFREVFVYDKQ